MKTTFDQLRDTQPQFFSAAALTIPAASLQAMADLVAAIESVIALPAYQAHALAQAPAIARLPCAARGAFMGYDFHLTAAGPKLIEINTNAGGGLLNAYLLAEHGRAAEGARIRDEFVAMFREEWRLERGDTPLRRIAIVDENPAEQFLAPEFTLFRALFEEHGIAAVVCDPSELSFDGEALRHAGQPVDLVYKRLTDFALDTTASTAIRTAFEQGKVVLTPNPRAHALYADKRNLIELSDPERMAAWGLDAGRRAALSHVPSTLAVTPETADDLWARRKALFFKPTGGYGGKAVYRGDKLTRGVFAEILQGGYIAQALAPPSERQVQVDGAPTPRKVDVRLYAYAGEILLTAARVYQGQTTNFRTPGGGFAPVILV